MIKLEEAKQAFYDASATLSENVRKLAFAGIAIIWIFRVGNTAANIAFPRPLLWPLIAFIAALILDVAQYLYKSTTWWLYYAWKHKQGVHDDGEVDPPGIINFFTGIFFYLKVACVAYAYYELFSFVAYAIAHTRT